MKSKKLEEATIKALNGELTEVVNNEKVDTFINDFLNKYVMPDVDSGQSFICVCADIWGDSSDEDGAWATLTLNWDLNEDECASGAWAGPRKYFRIKC